MCRRKADWLEDSDLIDKIDGEMQMRRTEFVYHLEMQRIIYKWTTGIEREKDSIKANEME